MKTAPPVDPRVLHTKSVVLAAARDLLFEEGRDAVTAVRISERTGVARTTIYRHWPDQTQLLLATIESCIPAIEYEPIGDLRQDLVAYLAEGSRLEGRFPVDRLFAAMLELADHSDQVAGCMQRIHDFRAGPVFSMLDAAIERGEVSPEIDRANAIPLLVGPLFFRRLVLKLPLTTEFIEASVDSFLRGAAPE